MTQEEKAKRYDDAVRKAKVIIKNYSEDKASITVLETIFPELKESEDERIKREILECVSISGNGNQFEEIKNWLEKKTIIIPKFRVGDEIKTTNEKPLTVTKIDEEGYWSEDLFICDFDEECKWDFANEQKPVEGSEKDDERIRKGIKSILEHYKESGEVVCPYPFVLIDEALTWLEKKCEQPVEPDWCHHKVDFSSCSEEYRKAYYDGWNSCNIQHSQCRTELDDVIKCLLNGFKYLYKGTEEIDWDWGTNEYSMPVNHIIEVLEKHMKSVKTE